jgi:hypothetical protein
MVAHVNSVEQALADVSRVHPDLVDDARAAWDALTGGEGPGSLTQWRLQQFCWDGLVRAWAGDGATRWRLALALAALLDALGMPRYAAIARSETTRELTTSGESQVDRGRSSLRRAMQRSGIEPPDTELITWGSIMGSAESEAIEAVADRLELAVAVGDLQPGGRGWRDQQTEITLEELRRPRIAYAGRSLYDVILEERLDEWIRGPRSTTRSALLAPLEFRLVDPIDAGLAAPARELLRPLDWLLTEIGEGLTLTAAGYLPPRTVSKALDDLGWRDQIIGPATREVDAFPVLALRETATRLGLLRRRGNRLVPTPSGRAALNDGRVLWQAVAAAIVGPEHSALSVAFEVVLALLEPGDLVPEEDVRRLVQAVVTESGWRLAGRREPAESDTSALFYAVLRELRWLELVRENGSLLERRLQAAEGASDLFRASLRHRVLHRVIVPF